VAIGLKDVKKLKRESDGPSSAKEKALRPWQGYEDLGNQTRTVVAREAVRKAILTKEKNNIWIKNFKKKGEQVCRKNISKSELKKNGKLKIYKVTQLKKILGTFWSLGNMIRRLLN
jgi:hypothetical protein